MVTQTKVDAIQVQLRQNGIDALILCLSHNILAFLGYWTGGHAAKAVIPAEGKPALIIPASELCNAEGNDPSVVRILTYDFEHPTSTKSHMDFFFEIVRDVIPNAEQFTGTIGIEESFEDGSSANFCGEFKYPSLPTFNAIRAFFAKANVKDATGLITEMKFVKAPEELPRIRTAIDLVCAGLKVVRQRVRPGMTEAEVGAILESEVMINGTGKGGVRFSRCFASVYTGARSAEQNAYWAATSGRVVREGDVIILEIGSVSDGYWCDLTRCICVGKPDETLTKRYDAVKRARQAGLASIREGALFSDVPKACFASYESEGYGPQDYRHAVGHGSGYNYHEGPGLHVANQKPMKRGTVLCLEPGLYFPGQYGLRIEDMVVVTETGYELLSHCGRELTT